LNWRFWDKPRFMDVNGYVGYSPQDASQRGFGVQLLQSATYRSVGKSGASRLLLGSASRLARRIAGPFFL
jgi:hypothetical protein